MKKVKSRHSFWQSALSVCILGVFAYIAMATFGGISQQEYQLPDGRWEISKHYSDGNTETTTGNVDGDGRWDGPVKVEYENDNYMLTHTEEVNMKEGNRHGTSKVTYPNGYVAYYCYQHGERVAKENCEKSASIETEDLSAYQIFSYKFPWFVFKLDAIGYDTNYVEAYMDTIETLLYAIEFTEEDYAETYEDVIEVLEDTRFDSIIQRNAELLLYNGLELILNHEFRLATLHSYRDRDSNTYNVVKTIYPNYLLKLSLFEISEADFEGFCVKYDSVMSGYEPIALDDPFLLDSLDERMYRAINTISSEDENSAIVVQSLKSAVLSGGFKNILSLKQDYFSQIMNQAFNNPPKDVAEVIIFTFLEKFILGDLFSNAVNEAYTLKKGIVTLPTLTTNFLKNNSSTSVSLNGNVIEDGGGDITSRGMVWGTGFNPLLTDNTILSGVGLGSFETRIEGLNESETYYARSFATNSAGTAYGNCITFTSYTPVGIESKEFMEMEFKVFPNPTSGVVNCSFQLDMPGNAVLSIVNMNGQVVSRKELSNLVQGENRIEMDLSDYKNGVYNCQITIDGSLNLNRKFLIAH